MKRNESWKGAAMPKPSAAQSLYRHLPSAIPEPSTQRRNSLGNALWPSLSREQKAKEADQALWNRILERQRQSFRQGLHEANANLDKRR
jgi:hypothetical protein